MKLIIFWTVCLYLSLFSKCFRPADNLLELLGRVLFSPIYAVFSILNFLAGVKL